MEFELNTIPAAVPPVAQSPKGITEITPETGLTPADQHEPTKEQIRADRIQFATLLWPLFLAGWNDATTGPLLPRIREVYNVGFAVVSLIFVIPCLGFVCGALLNVHFGDKLGFGKIIVLASLLQIAGYAIQSAAPPFPVFVISFFINGIGIAIQDAQANGYVATLKRNSETKMGILHAAYGAGALASPLISTQFAQMHRWSFHYLVSLGMSISGTILMVVVFKLRDHDDCLALVGQGPIEKSTSTDNKFRQILGQKTVHFLAFFILVNVGIGVTIGGWIVTFLISERGGGASSGYVSAGFFGGVMFGRVALLWLNKKIGERRAIFLYTVLAIGLELVVWLVPSLIGNAVAVSIVGMLLGPMYPMAMNHAGRVLPKYLMSGAIGWISGFGQAGAAALPFVTGAFSSRFGIKSLQPLVVAMMALMMVVWAIVPGSRRRAD